MWIASTRQRISMFIHRITFLSNAQHCLCVCEMWIAGTWQRMSMVIHRVPFFSNAQYCLCDFQSARWHSLLQYSMLKHCMHFIRRDDSLCSLQPLHLPVLGQSFADETFPSRQVHGILLPKNRVSPRSVLVWYKTFKKRIMCSLEPSTSKSDGICKTTDVPRRIQVRRKIPTWKKAWASPRFPSSVASVAIEKQRVARDSSIFCARCGCLQ